MKFNHDIVNRVPAVSEKLVTHYTRHRLPPGLTRVQRDIG